MTKLYALVATGLFLAAFDSCNCSKPASGGEGESGEGEGEGAASSGEGEGAASSGEGEGAASSGEGEGEGLGTGGCGPYEQLCNNVCTPTTLDPDHCGGCASTNVCTSTQVCSGGQCVDAATGCAGNLTACDRQCIDKNTDNDHCGGCPGQACGPTQGCSGGTCVDTLPLTPPPASLCQGGGAPVVVPVGNQQVCTGNLAQVSFRFGVCSCDKVTSSSSLNIDAFDSQTGPYVAGTLGGGLGANGKIDPSDIVTITGTMWTSSTQGLSSSSGVTAQGELHANGNVNTSDSMTFGLDAFVNGSAQNINVGGTLFVPTGKSTSGTNAANIVHQAVVDVPPPCDCDASQLIPINAIVEEARNDNDNALVGLSADALSGGGAPARVDLECGRYFFNAINAGGSLTVFAHGNVAIFVAGDVSTSNSLTFGVDPGGSMDIFVEGTMSSSDTLILGSPATPALTRVYAGAQNGISISSNFQVGGFIYALGSVDASSGQAIFGGVFAGEFSASAETNVHYDNAILAAGANCPPTTTGEGEGEGAVGGEGEGEGAVGGEGEGEGAVGGCTSCRDCGNQACNAGVCGACATSADCCAPLLCINSQCVPIGG
jgi:hypothetical protein